VKIAVLRDTLVAVDEKGPYRQYQAQHDAQPVEAFAKAVECLLHKTYCRGGQAYQVPWRIVRTDEGGYQHAACDEIIVVEEATNGRRYTTKGVCVVGGKGVTTPCYLLLWRSHFFTFCDIPTSIPNTQRVPNSK
jgi:hypothetical protein